MDEKIMIDLIAEIGYLAQQIKDNMTASRPIYTVPMASEMTKVEAIAARILTGLATRYTITNPEDHSKICHLSIDLAETLLSTLNARIQ